MNGIDARPKTIRELLNGVKYSIDYYQREYKWERRQIEELLDDLETQFNEHHREDHERVKVADYGHYFLGSIVINNENGQKYIIDGQQRLTSLTLLLIYLHNFQKDRSDRVDVHNLIFSEKFGKKTFNFDVQERTDCIDSLYSGNPYDANGQSESVRNIVARYNDIQELFPDTLKGKSLPYFIDWVLENVDLVEITAFSDDEAYTVFETMNDRGLSLSPTDMLKGYLLANINGASEKAQANDIWRDRLLELGALGKEEGANFFKAWLRAKFADTIREGKKGATNKDFDRIGTTFHRWLRDERQKIGLHKSDDFYRFVQHRFNVFSQHYLRVRQAEHILTPGLEHVYYNAHNGMTLQPALVLAAVRDDDDLDTANRKIRLVAAYLDIFVARRVWNFRTLGRSSIEYTMFNLIKEIRDRRVPELAAILKRRVLEMSETFRPDNGFRLHQQNGHHVHYLLARMTSHIEEQSSINSNFYMYVTRDSKAPFEIEHIWANKYERHTDEFAHQQDFLDYRNRIGGLILLPRRFNQSLGGDSFETKVKAYYSQNLLARSLNEQCYRNNPAFLQYVNESRLPFRPYDHFKKADLDERQELYRLICEEIWSIDIFEREL